MASVPDGQTQFNFHAAGMNFNSTSYQWLVIAGAKAQYKGSGAINGTGDYAFMLTAIDEQINGSGGVELFGGGIEPSASFSKSPNRDRLRTSCRHTATG